MTDSRRKILDNIIYELSGTTSALELVAEENGIEELSTEDLEYIESWIFQCNGCGWWCDVGEDEWDHLCGDCYEEWEKDEDDDEEF